MPRQVLQLVCEHGQAGLPIVSKHAQAGLPIVNEHVQKVLQLVYKHCPGSCLDVLVLNIIVSLNVKNFILYRIDRSFTLYRMDRNERCTDMCLLVHPSKLSTVKNSTLCRVVRSSVQVPIYTYVHRDPRHRYRVAGLSPDL
jgi:hypothetical protein